jgi:hypothetical protein
MFWGHPSMWKDLKAWAEKTGKTKLTVAEVRKILGSGKIHKPYWMAVAKQGGQIIDPQWLSLYNYPVRIPDSYIPALRQECAKLGRILKEESLLITHYGKFLSQAGELVQIDGVVYQYTLKHNPQYNKHGYMLFTGGAVAEHGSELESALVAKDKCTGHADHQASAMFAYEEPVEAPAPAETSAPVEEAVVQEADAVEAVAGYSQKDWDMARKHLESWDLEALQEWGEEAGWDDAPGMSKEELIELFLEHNGGPLIDELKEGEDASSMLAYEEPIEVPTPVEAPQSAENFRGEGCQNYDDSRDVCLDNPASKVLAQEGSEPTKEDISKFRDILNRLVRVTLEKTSDVKWDGKNNLPTERVSLLKHATDEEKSFLRSYEGKGAWSQKPRHWDAEIVFGGLGSWSKDQKVQADSKNPAGRLRFTSKLWQYWNGTRGEVTDKVIDKYVDGLLEDWADFFKSPKPEKPKVDDPAPVEMMKEESQGIFHSFDEYEVSKIIREKAEKAAEMIREAVFSFDDKFDQKDSPEYYKHVLEATKKAMNDFAALSAEADNDEFGDIWHSMDEIRSTAEFYVKNPDTDRE